MKIVLMKRIGVDETLDMIEELQKEQQKIKKGAVMDVRVAIFPVPPLRL